ncbi:FecCD family ABC transporter permease [Gordonia sp. VNK21]|uniref:FecCD family ABC transporter permease n=1 Tax=Gordonia sp. VNK21 TaxID=3382483 RepID=UPI0038D4030D
MTVHESGHRPPLPPSIRLGGLSFQYRPRALIVGVVLVVALVAAIFAALMLGDGVVSPGQLVEVLSGGGRRADRRLILDLRANRVLVAALAGAALGVAGAIMQTVTRNPLASPDILGITGGASVGAVAVIAIAGGDLSDKPWATPLGALIGGIAIAVAIAVFAASMDPMRMVLSGIALGALCGAVITYILATVNSDVASTAFAWMAGSLEGRGPEHIVPVAITLAVGVIVVVALQRASALLALGTPRARTLGVPVAGVERTLLLTSVLLASMATAATGPIGFIAFVAPQITVRLARTPSPPLITSGLTGAVLVLLADLLTRSVIPWTAPIGAVTSVIGAPVLIYFLWKASRV